MYIHGYVYIYVYIYIHTYVYIYIYLHIWSIHTYICIYVYVYIYTLWRIFILYVENFSTYYFSQQVNFETTEKHVVPKLPNHRRLKLFEATHKREFLCKSTHRRAKQLAYIWNEAFPHCYHPLGGSGVNIFQMPWEYGHSFYFRMIVGFSRMPCWVTVGHPENSCRFHTNWSALPVFISLPGAKCVAHKLSFFQQKRLSTCIAFHEFDASICIYIHVHMTLSSLHIFFLVKRVTLTQEHIDKVAHVHAHTSKQIYTCTCTQCLHHSLPVVCVYVCVYMFMRTDR